MVREFRCAACGAAGAVTTLPPICALCGCATGEVYGREGRSERLLAAFPAEAGRLAVRGATTLRRMAVVREMFASGERQCALRAAQARERLDWARAAREARLREHYARLGRSIAAEIAAMRMRDGAGMRPGSARHLPSAR